MYSQSQNLVGGADVAAIVAVVVMAIRCFDSEAKHEKMIILYTYPQINTSLFKLVAFNRFSNYHFHYFESDYFEL